MPPRSLPWQKRKESTTDSNEDGLVSGRQPASRRLPSPMRGHLAATISEFTGTFFFLFFALGGTHVVNSAPSSTPANQDPAKLLYIALCFGFSLAVNVWVFGRIQGSMFNPAVAIAMFATGGIGILRLVLVIVSQLAGSIAASGLVVGLLPGNGIQAQTRISDGVSLSRAFFIEFFLTTFLVLTIFMLAIEKHQTTALAPIGIGLALFLAELLGVFYTGGSLNPARSFGPEVVSRDGFPPNHWIYWVAPILGALLAAGFYKLVKLLKLDRIDRDTDEPAWRDEQRVHRKSDAQTAGHIESSRSHEDMV